tara:strand:- start:231 stop:515 length:285 start_codon:yes stop_codon:yes gene_type:complete
VGVFADAVHVKTTDLFPGVAVKLVGTVGVAAEAIPVKQTEMRVVVVNSANSFSAKLRIVAPFIDSLITKSFQLFRSVYYLKALYGVKFNRALFK